MNHQRLLSRKRACGEQRIRPETNLETLRYVCCGREILPPGTAERERARGAGRKHVRRQQQCRVVVVVVVVVVAVFVVVDGTFA